jgi:glyoxylase-like metal-dependent hydrolase (beta-lactamase superfamily II)
MSEATLMVETFYASPKGALVGSVLIEGEEEAILVDGQYTLSEATQLGEMIEESGKTLKLIWISHPHPDHFLGLEAILDKFPDTPVYATADVVADIQQRVATFVANAKKNFGDDVTDNPVIPEAYDEDFLELEGEKIPILELQGDAAHATILHVPSAHTVIVSDLVYMGTHAFMIEALTEEAQSAWIKNLEMLEFMEPDQVIPGHKRPDLELEDSLAAVSEMKDYIVTFAGAIENSETPDAAIAAMKEAYPEYGLPFILNMSVNAAFQNKG